MEKGFFIKIRPTWILWLLSFSPPLQFRWISPPFFNFSDVDPWISFLLFTVNANFVCFTNLCFRQLTIYEWLRGTQIGYVVSRAIVGQGVRFDAYITTIFYWPRLRYDPRLRFVGSKSGGVIANYLACFNVDMVIQKPFLHYSRVI